MRAGPSELLALLDAATWANARFVLSNRGEPCCVDCAALAYVPDEPAREVVVRTGAALLARRRASCGELAALAAGIARAAALAQGRSPDDARRVAWVELEQQSPVLWHAVCRYADGRTYDPAAEKR